MADNDLLRLTRTVPQSAFMRTTVRFPYANLDTAVPHTLRPSDPEAVQYYIVRANGPGFIYDNQSPGRLPWQATHIYLRSSTAGLAADLILILPDVEVPRRLLVTSPVDPYAAGTTPRVDQFEVGPGEEAQRIFTLSSIPVPGTLVVFLNGLRQKEDPYRDFTYQPLPPSVTFNYDLTEADFVTLTYTPA